MRRVRNLSSRSIPGERTQGPQILPDGRTVLFTLAHGDWTDAQVVVQSLDTSERRVLIEGGIDARYLPTGHLVYALAGNLLAVPFDHWTRHRAAGIAAI